MRKRRDFGRLRKVLAAALLGLWLAWAPRLAAADGTPEPAPLWKDVEIGGLCLIRNSHDMGQAMVLRRFRPALPASGQAPELCLSALIEQPVAFASLAVWLVGLPVVVPLYWTRLALAKTPPEEEGARCSLAWWVRGYDSPPSCKPALSAEECRKGPVLYDCAHMPFPERGGAWESYQKQCHDWNEELQKEWEARQKGCPREEGPAQP